VVAKMAEEEKGETEALQEKEVTEYQVTKEENEEQEDHKLNIRVLMIVVAVIVLVGVFFSLGYVVHLVIYRCGGNQASLADSTEKYIQEAANNMSSSNIREQLRYSTG